MWEQKKEVRKTAERNQVVLTLLLPALKPREGKEAGPSVLTCMAGTLSSKKERQLSLKK